MQQVGSIPVFDAPESINKEQIFHSVDQQIPGMNVFSAKFAR
jgi:hypothetical protein